MKKAGSFFIVILLSASCGSLRITPKGCKTNAVLGANPLSSREITQEEMEDRKNEIVTKKKITVFGDEDVRLRDLLEENSIKCSEVKKIRIQLSSSWLIFREVQLKIIKN